MYSLILGGGLGNQMFQYAYARRLSEEFGITFQYNLYSYDICNTEIEERQFSLKNFNIRKPYSFQERDSAIASYNFYKNCLKRKFLIRRFFSSERSIQSLANIGCVCSIQDPYSYQKILLPKKNGVIHGGFQSEKFFEPIKDSIKKELYIKKEISSKNKDIFNKIVSSNSVAVHIRRGDYLDPRYSNLNVCDESYYKKSVNYVIQHLEDPLFFIFSNTHADIEWIKEHYTFFPPNTIYVDNNNADFEDLQLIYNCNHFVISNSTFGWWGQYLSKNQKKLVISPKVWNLDCVDKSQDIFQDTWIRI